MTTTSPAALDRLARLIDGYLYTQLLRVLTELEVADALVGGDRSAAELAATVGADAEVLERVLRGLAAEGVLDELPGRRFALNEVGELLTTGHPRSMRGAVLARGEIYYRAVSGILAATRDGGTPFEIVNGQPFFAYLAAHPALGASFQESMTARSRNEAAAVAAVYDFSAFDTLIDVGGGSGLLLGTILAAYPDLDGTVFDLPDVVEGLAVPAVGGDFFDEVPAGADAYLLSRVIHDWDDAESVAILRTCRRAMPDTATLLLVEALMPEYAADDPAAIRMDLNMLALLHGRERTCAEFAALLGAAGLRLTGVTATDAGVHVLQARPIPGDRG